MNTSPSLSNENLSTNQPVFFNRELSWLDFNHRVIEEAYDSNNPLIEQLRFLAIGTSNADEFFMVRVAGVIDQWHAGIPIAENKTEMSPLTLLEHIKESQERNNNYQYERFHDLIMNDLPNIDYHFLKMANADKDCHEELQKYINRIILPSVTPIGLDNYRAFPMLKNNALNIFVQLKKDGVDYRTIVPIPNLIERFYIAEKTEKQFVVLIEDMFIESLSQLFQGYTIEAAFPFRITRSADFDIKEDNADDLIDLIEDYIQKRRTGIAVRLEIDARYLNQSTQKGVDFLVESLAIEDHSLYLIDGPLDLTFLFSLADAIAEVHPQLQYESFTPFLDPKFKYASIFDMINQEDLFFNHPYDSFQPIIQLIKEASTDPNTIAIKQTLYRVSKQSPIIKALKQAAANGKEVTVLVELRARFDEENNVHWAKELEEAGCHVIYGKSDLKTHSKITLIVRREEDQIRRYIHLGTGNYNDKTARTYTDMGIMTSHPEIGEDASKFFNYLSGYSEQPDYKHFHVSPFEIRDALIDDIDDEITFHKKNKDGRIIAKMNSLTDKTLIEKLYEASQAGVQIDLIVRGICCLVPGIPGLSENIRVRSIVGRFLEHSRIYAFYRHGESIVFLSSADMMTRNMIKRVEIEFPILDQSIQEKVLHVLDLQLSDNQKARCLQSSGEYIRPEITGEILNSQEQQMFEANQRKSNALRDMKSESANPLSRKIKQFFKKFSS